ncbi:hypothetical protein SAMN02745177_00921, partial [Desulforamulus hydrothermalis Lam5 = DSM 18033]
MNKKEFKQYIQAMVDSMLEKIPDYDASEEDLAGIFQEYPDDIPDELIEELYTKLQASGGFADDGDWDNIYQWSELLDWAGFKESGGYCSSDDSCDFCDESAWDNPCPPSKPKFKPPFKKHCSDDKWLKCFILTCLKLKLILCLLKNPRFGLQEIKREIKLIENAVFSPTFGLKEIKKEIRRLECGIFNPTFGLPEIKAEVSAIEAAVFSETFGLSEIKAEVSDILALVSNLDLALLSDIKS